MRALAWVLGLVAVAGVAAAAGGRLGAAFGVAAALAVALWVHVLLPRAAHRRFATGQAGAARWRYAALGALALTARGARRARLSAVACDVARGAYAEAAAALARIELEGLDTDGRVVVLGNRAYAALRAGAVGADAAQARTWAAEATRLRPDVPALGHTHALALARTGELGAAIGLLESLWADGALPPLLEAERCWSLADAWELRGEVGYGEEYRARAEVALSALGTRPPWAVRRSAPDPPTR